MVIRYPGSNTRVFCIILFILPRNELQVTQYYFFFALVV